MNFILRINHDNNGVQWINTTAKGTEPEGLEMAGFQVIKPDAELSYTFWRNQEVTKENPHPFNRVNVHTDYGTGVCTSFYCVSEIHEIVNGRTEIRDR